MLKKYFVANWKMKLSPEESLELIKATAKKLKIASSKVEVIFCPSFEAIKDCLLGVKNTELKVGAQDVFWEDKGSYTGEVSPANLKELGCAYVILGHSERRKNLGETNGMVNKKIQACLRHNLTPIVCIGDTLEDRQSGQEVMAIERQVHDCFQNIAGDQDQQIVVCYEPVWAISDNLGDREITNQDIEQMIEVIHQSLYDVVSVDLLENNFNYIFGGNVNSDNIDELLKVDSLQGGLVGAASLKSDEIISVVKTLAKKNN